MTRHLFVVRSLGGVTELSSSDSDIVVGHIEGVTFVPASNLEGFGYNGYTNGKLGILIDVDAPDAQTVYEDARNIQFYFGGSYVDLRIEIRVLPTVDGDIHLTTNPAITADIGESYHLFVGDIEFPTGASLTNEGQRNSDGYQNFFPTNARLIDSAADLIAYGVDADDIVTTGSTRTVGALIRVTVLNDDSWGEFNLRTRIGSGSSEVLYGLIHITVNGGEPVPLTIHDYSSTTVFHNGYWPTLNVDEDSGPSRHLFIVQHYGDGVMSVNSQGTDNDYISDVSFVSLATLRSDYEYTGGSSASGILFTVTPEEISESSREDWVRTRYQYGTFIARYIKVIVNDN